MAHATKYGTIFFERYARISLIDIFGEKFSCLINSDRPDLQDVNGNLGIEVTRAMQEKKNVARMLENDIAGEQINNVSEAEIAQMQKQGYSYGLYQNIVGEKEREYWASALPLWRILESKIHKVADGFYGNFKEYGLYIFSKENLVKDDIVAAIVYANKLQNGNTKRYSTMYISQINEMYICDLEQARFSHIEINKEQCRKFYNEAIKNE